MSVGELGATPNALKISRAYEMVSAPFAEAMASVSMLESTISAIFLVEW